MPFDVANKRWVCDSCGTPTIRTASGWTCPNNMVCGARIVTGFKGEREVEVGGEERVVSDELDDEDDETCDWCDGTGEVECDECGGDGIVICEYDHEHTCPECDGDGMMTCLECDEENLK